MLIQMTRNFLFNNSKSISRILKPNKANNGKLNVFISSKYNNIIQTSKFY